MLFKTESHVLKVVYFMTIVLSVILILKCGYLIYIQETTICLWRSLIAFHFQCLPLTIFTTVKCNRNYLYRVYHKKEQFKISGINCNKVQPTLYIIHLYRVTTRKNRINKLKSGCSINTFILVENNILKTRKNNNNFLKNIAIL